MFLLGQAVQSELSEVSLNEAKTNIFIYKDPTKPEN
jgi:hypothetical protein